MAKSRSVIAAEDVDRVFDYDQIAELTAIAKLPADADRQRFAEGVRDAVRIYARDAREPSVNDLHREIEKLHRAAERQQYDQLAVLVEGLSPKARNLLNTRGARLGVMLPSPEALRGAQHEEACAAIVKLTQFGGEDRKGRKRPGGKRSPDTWRPHLYAPSRQRNFPKREAERTLIIMLQAAWLDAVGTLPSRAVNRDRPSGFAKMAARCFQLIGARADVADLINTVNRHGNELRRREQAPQPTKARLSHIKTRTN
jgi:hypothetical protein